MGPDQGGNETREPDEIISSEEALKRQFEQREAQIRAEYEQRIDRILAYYDERTGKARRSLAARVLHPKVLAKNVGMLLLESHSILTGYTLGDAIAGVNGALDLIAAHHQKDRDPEERAKLRLKGALNIGAALIPGLPASATTPTINAAINVEREDRPR